MVWTTSDKEIVLIVNHEPESVLKLLETMRKSGYAAVIATDGLSAIRHFNHLTPDLVLLDADMPQSDAFETCMRIRTQHGARDIPIIFMTELANAEQISRGFAAGGTDYLIKPIRSEEVLARAGAHIKEARMFARLRNLAGIVEQAVVAVDRDNVPVWHTRKVVPWIMEHFDDACPRLSALPSRVQSWLDGRLAESVPRPRPIPPLVTVAGRRKLTIRLLQENKGGKSLLLFEEGLAGFQDDRSRAADYNLTPREVEVLAWIARGKTNRDIAEILQISPRTVNKHLERIFVKLGVETRSAAAVLAVSANLLPNTRRSRNIVVSN